MELLQIENLSFSYPKCDMRAIDDISISIKIGGFTLLCGESGCGKTTLLRLIKREISPCGKQSGKILYCGESTDSLHAEISASEIGFVGQNPDEQIVTDKVWHELAFGLESLGLESSLMRRRVAETANYFGIQSWYHKDVNELSGGQKQLLNLAAVMVMQPKLLLLDEPCAQLDPIAAADFIAVLQKLNRELGLTVILAEHRLEELFAVADSAIIMEKGKIICRGTPRQVCEKLKEHPLSVGFPSAARIWKGLEVQCACPITVKEGRELILSHYGEKQGEALDIPENMTAEPVITARGVYFRYGKDGSDVLRDLSINVGEGEIYSVLGGNGSGKTTALNVLSGLCKPYKGEIKIFGKKIKNYKDNSLYRGTLSMLPQDPKTLFLCDSVQSDYERLLKALGNTESERRSLIKELSERFGITELLSKHPYDLSGGEQQKCALVKLLLTRPRILLMDEPTKGLDAYYKQRLAKLLKQLKADGMTILAVTHDVEFAAEVSDRCALFFDGGIISEGTPRIFFSDNNFYTTAAARISRGIFKNAVLCKDVIELCRR